MFQISAHTRSLIRGALREDVGRGDVTTRTLIPSGLFGEGGIQIKAKGILCGGPVVKELFRLVDPRLVVEQKIPDGSRVSKGKKVFVIRGRVASILKGERVALNFLGHLSGIATLTNQFVCKVPGTHAKVLDTRKTTPLWRELEKYAVRCGGGKNHRFGLWDEILVKDNHWFSMRPLLDRNGCHYFESRLVNLKKMPIEIEIQNLKGLAHLLEGSFCPDRILLDNFSVSNLKRAVQMVRQFRRHVGAGFPRPLKRPAGAETAPLLEASGGVTLRNVRAIARTGVDRISVGALTHSAPALDVSLKIEKVW